MTLSKIMEYGTTMPHLRYASLKKTYVLEHDNRRSYRHPNTKIGDFYDNILSSNVFIRF